MAEEVKIPVTQEQLLEVAREAGLNVELVDKNEAFDINALLGAVDNHRKPFIQKDIEATVVPEAVSRQVGKVTGSIRHELKKLTGYDNKDEAIEDVIKKGFELYGAKAKEGVTADVQTLQQRIEDLAAEKDKERDEAVQAVTGKYTELQQRILDKEAVELLHKHVGTMKLRGDSVTHTKDLYDSLRRDYTVAIDGDELKFFDKSSPNIPAQLNKKSFSLAEYSTAYFESRGAIEKDMRSKNPADTKRAITLPVGVKTQRMTTAAKAAEEFLNKFAQ
jgi:hypothetical protein